MNLKRIIILCSSAIIVTGIFTQFANEASASISAISSSQSKKEPRIFNTVSGFVKKFNQEGSDSVGNYHIDSYKVISANGLKTFKASMGETKVLTGVVNPDNSLKNVSFTDKVYYMTTEDAEEAEGDLGVDRMMFNQQMVNTLNPKTVSSYVSTKVWNLLGLIPRIVDSEKDKKSFNKKISIYGLTYNISLSKNDFYTYKVSK
ncbi:hypothetical protein MKY98_26755 [Paenibacillus sp. FSL M8-0228]|uniref:hypothetical protein n=1 Tax=Paenibacillus TaxID=44249 RepID=UPI00083CFE0D|nr:hypothetical protein [Paenibacillus polymyxa]MBO3287566.1 hypothetical protein [Paenibacillus polymyxa]ODB54941.1 hypothetical protein A7311_20915 [Paenibacillus polymyxa]